MTRGGANYRVKWSHFYILRAPGAVNTENTVKAIQVIDHFCQDVINNEVSIKK